MGWKTKLVAAYGAGQYASAKAAEQVRKTFALLRTIQALLLVAIVVLLGTIAISLAQPTWTPYAYGIGALVLAVPLIAVLVLVWLPLRNSKLRRTRRWAEGAPDPEDVARLRPGRKHRRRL